MVKTPAQIDTFATWSGQTLCYAIGLSRPGISQRELSDAANREIDAIQASLPRYQEGEMTPEGAKAICSAVMERAVAILKG